MIVTIHQPEHMPWCGFIHKALQADVFVLLDNVQFRKNYFQNRNRILGPNGPQWLTVPVLQKGHMDKTIGDIEIVTDRSWADKWWKSLYFSYRHLPHFAEHAGFFESVAKQPWRRIADMNEAVIRHLFGAFGVACRILKASQLPVSGTQSALLSGICSHLGAREYLAGQYGRDYLDEGFFREAGIAVRHHQFSHPVYAQRAGQPFEPQMSSVDLLFRFGPASRQILLAGAPSPAVLP